VAALTCSFAAELQQSRNLSHFQAAEAAAANETRQQRRLQRHRERLKELREEAAAKAEGRPWPPPGGTPKRTTNGAPEALHGAASFCCCIFSWTLCMHVAPHAD
jgi:hypothetical protein